LGKAFIIIIPFFFDFIVSYAIGLSIVFFLFGKRKTQPGNDDVPPELFSESVN